MEKIAIYDLINNEYNSSKLPYRYNASNYNSYGNFTLKHMKLVNRLAYLNKLLEEQYQIWLTLINEPRIDKSSDIALIQSILKHKEWQNLLTNNNFKQEELIMHLRKAVDECVVLLSIATNCFIEGNKNGTKRPFESVGEIINQIDRIKLLKPHKDFLMTINDISNGFKHCVANSVNGKIGKLEPCVFIYTNEKDKRENYCEIGITINNIVVEFNKFYFTIYSIIKNG